MKCEHEVAARVKNGRITFNCGREISRVDSFRILGGRVLHIYRCTLGHVTRINVKRAM